MAAPGSDPGVPSTPDLLLPAAEVFDAAALIAVASADLPLGRHGSAERTAVLRHLAPALVSNSLLKKITDGDLHFAHPDAVTSTDGNGEDEDVAEVIT